MNVYLFDETKIVISINCTLARKFLADLYSDEAYLHSSQVQKLKKANSHL